LTYVLSAVTPWLRLGVLSAGCGHVAAPIVSTGSVELVLVLELVVVLGDAGTVDPIAGVVDALVVGTTEVGVVLVLVLEPLPTAGQAPDVVEDEVVVAPGVPTGDGTVDVVELVVGLVDVVEPD
jgi:hypothetical protein